MMRKLSVAAIVFLVLIGLVQITDALKYSHVGCFVDKRPPAGPRAMPELVDTWKDDSIQKCAQAIKQKGYSAFGVQNGGECWSGPLAHMTYNKYGAKGGCKDGTGGDWRQDVYIFFPLKYSHVGCFVDKRPPAGPRAMPELVDTWKDDSIQKCAQAIKQKGYSAFGVQNGGECWSGPLAHMTYNKYGAKGGCKDGTGGDWRQDVYIFIPLKYSHVGCFVDKRPPAGPRAMPELVDTWKDDSIQKCAQAIKQKGYSAFGVQNGGECWSGPLAHMTYNKYGAKGGCKDGTGGDWRQDVYIFIHVNQCAMPDACPPNSSCKNVNYTYTCECRGGFKYEIKGKGKEREKKCVDKDECTEVNGSCPLADSHCKNTFGSYRCVCNQGYKGYNDSNGRLTVCKDVDECKDPSLFKCPELTSCANQHGGYTCACAPGYESAVSGKTKGMDIKCKDIDECLEKTFSCDPASHCKNTHGGYDCKCKEGYFKTGQGTCEEECGVSCDEYSFCRNGKCLCLPGYSLGPYNECYEESFFLLGSGKALKSPVMLLATGLLGCLALS